MGIKRNGVKVLLKHDGDLVEKVMTKSQFEAFIKSSIIRDSAEEVGNWFLLGNKPCIIDKYGNEVVKADKIEEYHGFEKEKATPQGKDDYFMHNTDLMEVFRTHQVMNMPKEQTTPMKRIIFGYPDDKKEE